MPPQHNLSQHLKWLLNAKPFVPPSVPLVAYNPEDAASVDALVEEASFLVDAAANNEPAPAAQPARAPASAAARPPPPRTLARTKTVDIHKPPETEGEDGDMARLRATPSNGKPRLVLAGFHHTVPRRPWAYDTKRTSVRLVRYRKTVAAE